MANRAGDTITRKRTVLGMPIGTGRIDHIVGKVVLFAVIKMELALSHGTMAAVAEVIDVVAELRVQRLFGLDLSMEYRIASR